MDFYPGIFGNFANVVILGSIPYLVALLRSDLYEENYRSQIGRFSTYEVVAWSSITAIPLFAMVLAKTVTHGYTERYALSGIIGGVVLLCHFGFALAPRPRSFAMILSSVGLVYFVFHSIWIMRIHGLNVSMLAEQMDMLDSIPHLRLLFRILLFSIRRRFMHQGGSLRTPFMLQMPRRLWSTSHTTRSIVDCGSYGRGSP